MLSTEYLYNKLEYLKGGLILIEKERNELKRKFLRLQFTPNNIRKYKQIKAEYTLVTNTINFIERAIK